MVSKGAVSIHYNIILVGGLSISNHNKCTMHLPTQKHAIEITLMDCTQLKMHRLFQVDIVNNVVRPKLSTMLFQVVTVEQL